MRAYVVETEALVQNIRVLKERAGSVPVWAVLKGDGMGIGAVPLAAILAQQGIRRFCVTEVHEAKALRDAGFTEESILMLRPTADKETVGQLLDLNVICTVSSQSDAVILNGVAAERGTVAEAHIKIDTGMGRYGFLPKEMDKIISVYAYMDAIAVSGIYTHFFWAFKSDKRTREQFEQFQYVLDQIAGKGYEPGEAHCCNSSALLRFDDMQMQGVRVGSALLGRLSFRGSCGLRRVGFCEGSIDEVKWLPKGHTTGYGGAWKAKKPTRVAVVNVGWYHGLGVDNGRDVFRFRDCLRGGLSLLKAWLIRKKLYVRIAGQKCPVLGHVGMMHCAVNVTKLDCNVGDKVVVDLNPLLKKGMPVDYR